jgi:hypothetical protein
VCAVHSSSFDFNSVVVSALRASVLLPKSTFISFLWLAAGSVLLLSGGQALLASRPVACFSISGFHSFSCRSGLSSVRAQISSAVSLLSTGAAVGPVHRT